MDTPAEPKPYKILDSRRERRVGITALTLDDVIGAMREKFKATDEADEGGGGGGGGGDEKYTVVLESDGTEIDDEEYFATLEPDTCLMGLRALEKWSPNVPRAYQRAADDQTDGSIDRLANLVGHLKQNLCHISLLNEEDLELLSDMNPENVLDLEKDMFLQRLKDASGRFLMEKQEAKDAMELLKLYHDTMKNSYPEK